MKLRTRIICLSSVAVFMAILISDGIIWKFNEGTMQSEARMKGGQSSYTIMNELNSYLEAMGALQSESIAINYFFKSQKDDYSICIRMDKSYSFLTLGEEPGEVEEIYNHTIFSVQELLSLNYRDYEELCYAEFSWKGSHFLIFAGNISKDLLLFHIVDVTYVWEKSERLIIIMALITIVVMAVVVLMLSFVLKRALRPLQELNTTTKRMAEGFYDQRVLINGRDEIGQLGENFNKMAEAVEIRTHNLEESEQKKTLFMGNLTHELKTPMTAISGYAQTLLSTRISREDEEEALHYIHEECGRLERLSKKMMKLLELEQEVELELQDTPVRTLFEAAERSCRVILQEKQITLAITEHGEHFTMDMDLMTDVIINLIDNAVKASRTGGRICLRAEGNTIQVQDFGQGIPREEQERILEPFYMIDKSRSRKSGGAGLGLALAVMIVKRHKASLRIESEAGEGTRMILQFV